MSDLMVKTKKGLLWSSVERLLSQMMQLVIMLILARYLGPTALGLIGMLAIFISISNVFIDSGFSSAIIRKINHTEDDLATAFYYNIFISILCYFILYTCAPYIAIFYQQSELKLLLRIIGITVLINAFTMIPRVKLTISMDFKILAKISVVSVLISGVIAIVMAVNNYGVWSLVAQTVCSAVFTALLLNVFSPWYPTGCINKASFNYLFGFGSKLLISGVLDAVYNNLYQIIIGRKFTPAVVGEFTQANQLSSLPAMTLMSIVQRVTYPMLSQLQMNTAKMEETYETVIKIIAVVIFPTIIGLGIIAKPLIILILGESWRGAANLISILCIGYMLYPIHVMNVNFLQVKGRSDLFLKSEIVKKAIGVSILVITTPLGVQYMCIGLSLSSYISLFLNFHYTNKVAHNNQWSICIELASIWVVVIVSALIAYGGGQYWENTPTLQILMTIIISLLLYIGYIFVMQRALVNRIKVLLWH